MSLTGLPNESSELHSVEDDTDNPAPETATVEEAQDVDGLDLEHQKKQRG